MQTTLRKELTRLERLAASGAISDDDFKLAMRERRGKLLTSGGRLARKRVRDGIAASELVSREHSVPRQVEFGVRATEIVARDAMIRLDKQCMANGFRSMLIKVVKGNKPVAAKTTMQVAIEDSSIMEQIKASLGTV